MPRRLHPQVAPPPRPSRELRVEVRHAEQDNPEVRRSAVEFLKQLLARLPASVPRR